MDNNRVVTALVESAIAYAFYLLTTTPEHDLRRVESQTFMVVAKGFQSTAAWFGKVGIVAERKAHTCLS